MDLITMAAGGLLFIILGGAVLALVAHWKGRSWLAWGVAGAVSGLIPVLGALAWIGMLLYLLLAGRGTAGWSDGPKDVPDFTPTFQNRNIALDAGRDLLWIRDASGESRVFRREEILRWNTDCVQVTKGGRVFPTKCGLDIHVRDLARPHWKVKMDRNGTGLIRSEIRNGQEMEEWQSRLTTWINS